MLLESRLGQAERKLTLSPSSHPAPAGTAAGAGLLVCLVCWGGEASSFSSSADPSAGERLGSFCASLQELTITWYLENTASTTTAPVGFVTQT